jgi:hypothetical protein
MKRIHIVPASRSGNGRQIDYALCTFESLYGDGTGAARAVQILASPKLGPIQKMLSL